MEPNGAGAEEAVMGGVNMQEAVMGGLNPEEALFGGLNEEIPAENPNLNANGPQILNPVVAPPATRIGIVPEFGVNIVQYIARPTARWAARYSPQGILLGPVAHDDLSEDDMRNAFTVYLTFTNLHDVPERDARFVVRGRERIEEVCRKMFRTLDASTLWDHGTDYAVFFSTKEPKKLYIPAGTRIGEVLISHPNDRATGIELDCLLAEPNQLHGIFGIVPAAGAA